MLHYVHIFYELHMVKLGARHTAETQAETRNCSQKFAETKTETFEHLAHACKVVKV